MAVVLGGAVAGYPDLLHDGFSKKHPKKMPIDLSKMGELDKYFYAQSDIILEKDFTKSLYVHGSISALNGIKVPNIPEEPIKIFMLDSALNEPWIPVYDTGLYWIVNNEVRSAFEEFEIGVHQFIPVKFVDQSNNDLKGPQYWVVNLGLSLDTVSRGGSCLTYATRLGFDGHPNVDYVTTDFNDHSEKVKIALDKGKVANHGVWYDYVLGRPVMSSAFEMVLIEEGYAPYFLSGLMVEERCAN